MRLILVNPNTSAETTASMAEIARAAAGQGCAIKGLTAPSGAPLITQPDELSRAADVVVGLAPELAGADAVVVAGFGDPGLEELRNLLSCPVTGIAEAGMAEAAAGGRRFAVVTTTPALRDAIAAKAARDGHARFAGTWCTPGDPATLMADPEQLLSALETASRKAVRDGAAEAIVIGGGPLALAARVLAGTLPVPLIEPVPAAVRLSLARCGREQQP